MAYPTSPVTFVTVGPGENRTDVANLLGAEITAIEQALLYATAQTTAPIRMRQSGNLIEWGPAAAGRLSTLGTSGGKSFVGLGCEAGAPGKFTTRAQAGIVLTNDGNGGLVVQSVPLVNTADQTPVNRLLMSRSGYPLIYNPVLGSWANGAISVVSTGGSYTNVTYNSGILDPWGFYLADAAGNFKIPVGMGGVYLWIGAVGWPANASGNRGASFSPGSRYYDYQLPDDLGTSLTHQTVMVRNMAAGDIFNLGILQSSGVTLSAAVTVRMTKLL